VAEAAASGDVRILAVTSEQPAEGVDAPTLKAEGVDLTFTNWRGIVAAPGISEEEKQRFIDTITQMHESQAWQQVLEDQRWTDAFVTGDEFAGFLQDESDRVESVLSELGLA
jgi:putative tricarboxylic transport membrane protein